MVKMKESNVMIQNQRISYQFCFRLITPSDRSIGDLPNMYVAPPFTLERHDIFCRRKSNIIVFTGICCDALFGTGAGEKDISDAAAGDFIVSHSSDDCVIGTVGSPEKRIPFNIGSEHRFRFFYPIIEMNNHRFRIGSCCVGYCVGMRSNTIIIIFPE